eukprot:2324435-Prorocentrum_lima.AAC.1
MFAKRDKLHIKLTQSWLMNGLGSKGQKVDQRAWKSKSTKTESKTLAVPNNEAQAIPDKEWSKCDKEQVLKRLETLARTKL